MRDFVGYEPNMHSVKRRVDGRPRNATTGIGARLLHGVLCVTAQLAPAEPIFSASNTRNRASIDLHERVGFVEAGRAATVAGIDCTGGAGVLLRYP